VDVIKEEVAGFTEKRLGFGSLQEGEVLVFADVKAWI
jgi:hypothetical protein